MTQLRDILKDAQRRALSQVSNQYLLLNRVCQNHERGRLISLGLTTANVHHLKGHLVHLLTLLMRLVIKVVNPRTTSLTKHAGMYSIIRVAIHFMQVSAILSPSGLLSARVLERLLLGLLLNMLQITILIRRARLNNRSNTLAVAIRQTTLRSVVLKAVTIGLLRLYRLRTGKDILIPQRVRTIGRATMDVGIRIQGDGLAVIVGRRHQTKITGSTIIMLRISGTRIFGTIRSLARHKRIFNISTRDSKLGAYGNLSSLNRSLLHQLNTTTPRIKTIQPRGPNTLLLLVLTKRVRPILLEHKFALMSNLRFGLLGLNTFT